MMISARRVPLPEGCTTVRLTGPQDSIVAVITVDGWWLWPIVIWTSDHIILEFSFPLPSGAVALITSP